jgi:hypothetical protein
VLRWLRAYTSSDNPRVLACNTVAMVIAWNQPYYPLYLWWIVGRDAWVGIPDAFSGILFFAVPAIARRSGMLGRVAMVTLSVANVVFCSMMLGEAAGVQLLFLPCGMLAAMLFTWRERFVMLAMTALPLVAWLMTRGRLNIPLVRFPPEALCVVVHAERGQRRVTDDLLRLAAGRDQPELRGTAVSSLMRRPGPESLSAI